MAETRSVESAINYLDQAWRSILTAIKVPREPRRHHAG